MNIKEMGAAIEQIAKEKGLQPDRVINAIETAIAAAYKKEYRKRTEVIRAKFDVKNGDLSFVQVKTVVDPNEVRIVEETPEEEKKEEKEPVRFQHKEEEIVEEEGQLPRYIPDRHIFLEEAKMIKPDAIVGEELEFPLETHSDFGRIAAQTAKQVVLQGLRDAERASVQEEYADKEGEIVSGIIQRFDRGNVFIDLGRAIGVMFRNETIPGEHYRAGERMRFIVLAVQNDVHHPGIILSRSHPKFVQKLFELEVPEIADGTVEIKSVAREAGSRTKIAVYSKEEGVDPVGSAVGQRGTRVMAVTNELGNEKIDIIEWSEDPEKYLANAISPAKAVRVEIGERREAKIIVADDQLSLAIGKGGQNVRLAVKLTGWKIDIRAESNPDAVQEHGTADITPEQPEELNS